MRERVKWVGQCQEKIDVLQLAVMNVVKNPEIK